MTGVRPVRSTDRLTDAEIRQVLDLAAAAGEADGVYPLSEDAVLRVRHGGGTNLLSYEGDDLAGFANVAADAGELVVHPRHRRRGHGTALLTAAGPGPRTFWAHGDEPGARAFAGRNGFARERVLWQMRRSLRDELPEVPLPAGVTIRGFRPGHDEKAWLEVNARAFAHHPEQGRWTGHDLELREAEPWFDPAGFLLAVDIEDTLLGFHWTKVHPAAGDEPAIGEIYVLGVDPAPGSAGTGGGPGAGGGAAGHRRGLGTALSVAGLRHLAEQGLTEAMLYVDESNTAAVALYRRLGFGIHSTDVAYRRDA